MIKNSGKTAFRGFEVFWNDLEMRLGMYVHMVSTAALIATAITILLSFVRYPKAWAALWSGIDGPASVFYSLGGLFHIAKAMGWWWIGVFVVVVALGWKRALAAFERRDKEVTEIQHISGTKLVSQAELGEEIRQDLARTGNSARYTILPGVPWPDKRISDHQFVAGRTGSGKSLLLFHLLDQIADLVRDRCIVYDFDGSYIQRYYNPERGDVIFSPLHPERCIGWNIFNEMQDSRGASMVAHSFIPKNDGNDRFWNESARDLLLAIIATAPEKTNASLWATICTPESQLRALFESHEAGRIALKHLSAEGGNQAGGVIGTLMSYVRSVGEVQYLDGDFSLRSWARGDYGPAWLFVETRESERLQIQSVLSLAIDLVAKEILALDNNIDPDAQKTFVIIDEFASLNRLPSVLDLLQYARKKGASVALGVQDLSVLRAVYGRDVPESLYNNTGTHCILKCDAPETAEYLSKSLGDQEVIDPTETFSMGTNDMKDGRSIAQGRKVERTVTMGEILSIPNLGGYLSISGYNIGKITVPIPPPPAVSKEVE